MLCPALALFFRLGMADGDKRNCYYHSQEVFYQIESVYGILHNIAGLNGIGNKRAHEIQGNADKQLRMKNYHSDKSQLSLVAQKRTIDTCKAIDYGDNHE